MRLLREGVREIRPAIDVRNAEDRRLYSGLELKDKSRMRRFLSLRDFDWVLLSLVLLLSVISVFEIYSATMHTKFVGFHKTQIIWLLGGLVCMFGLSLVNYHRLIDYVHYAYIVSIVAL